MRPQFNTRDTYLEVTTAKFNTRETQKFCGFMEPRNLVSAKFSTFKVYFIYLFLNKFSHMGYLKTPTIYCINTIVKTKQEFLKRICVHRNDQSSICVGN